MIEKEFAAAKDGPVKVLNKGSAVGFGGSGQRFQHFLFLTSGWIAGEGAEVKVFDDFFVWCVFLDEFGYPTVFRFELFVDGVAIGDVEDLRHTGFHGALAFAGFFALRSAKG